MKMILTVTPNTALDKVLFIDEMNALLITCAEDRILAFTPQGDFHAIAPRQEAVNAAGAGEAASSGLV
jgi:fructose-1-phosphate kinase PfkB-like protein